MLPQARASGRESFRGRRARARTLPPTFYILCQGVLNLAAVQVAFVGTSQVRLGQKSEVTCRIPRYLFYPDVHRSLAALSSLAIVPGAESSGLPTFAQLSFPSRITLPCRVLSSASSYHHSPDRDWFCDARGPYSGASAGSGFGPIGRPRPESAGSNFAPYFLHFVSRCVEFGRGAGRVRRSVSGSTGPEIRGHLPSPLPLLSCCASLPRCPLLTRLCTPIPAHVSVLPVRPVYASCKGAVHYPQPPALPFFDIGRAALCT